MQRSHLSYVFLGSFLIAVFFLQWWQSSSYLIHVWLILGLIALLGMMGIFLRMRLAAATIALSLGLTLAFLDIARTTHVPSPNSVDSYATGEKVTILGTVADDPDRRSDQTKYTIEAHEIERKGQPPLKVHGLVLATVLQDASKIKYGDEVRTFGVLEKPKASQDFRYDFYLSRYNIYALLSKASISKSRGNSGNRFLGFLYSIKHAFESKVNELFPEPDASLLAGLILGSKRGLPAAVLADFQTVGLTHIIAISGFNISVILIVLSRVLFFIPLRLRGIPLGIGIIAFTLLTGASASAVRAAVMGILGLLAIQTGRLTTMRLSILWTAFFMLLWNPKMLWYDAGFQLSFLALIGLVECSPLVDRVCSKLPETLGIRESLQMTLAAELTTVPLIMLLFGRFSIIAPIANLLTAPAVPLAMLFGFLATLAGFVSQDLGRIIAIIGWLALHWIIGISHLLAEIPFASISTGFIGVPLICAWYAGLAVCCVRHATNDDLSTGKKCVP